ncbi:TonB-dependent receptor [Phenylobacterium sp.]|uniref:TonB-dependent receptor n=1 Tax=Phenylobacterium sp. TaxID=1871053 RepID=UPI0011F6A268|nr:TonB-dependent receptor [Phenylobacterium sp.]THD65041.1 MAG: TonB-dependent receptor [Phenylobacterium sp.]
MIRRGLRKLLLACLAAAGPAFADPPVPGAPPANPAAPAEKSVDEVVVTAQSPSQDRVEIDRRSYAVGKTIQAQSGTVADLLRTVPSVGVDLQGNVSLRGDQNVTILVDGKPAGEFSGAARGTAVQSLPADRYERVEVITNPSAADQAQGGAGIINLITKQAHKAGYSGSAKVGVGERGQAIAGITESYNTGKLSLSGDLNYRGRDPASGKITEQIVSPLAAGGSQTERQVDSYDATVNSVVARLAADYDLDDRTRIGARLQGVTVRLGQTGDVLATLSGASDGASDAILRQRYDDPVRVDTRLAGASFRRKLGDDQDLTVDLRTTRMAVRSDGAYQDAPVLPAGPDSFELSASAQTTDTTEIRTDYKDPSFADGELKLGYDGAITTADLSKIFGEGPSPGAIAADPTRSGAFAYRLELNAAYATLQEQFGDLSVLAGLRLENSRTTTSLADGSERRESDLLQAFPSLHLSYPLGEDRTVSASYSRRIDRPTPAQLSPLITFGNPQDLYGGNPDLRPQETDSFEAAYDAHKGASSFSATLFYRELHNAFTPVVLDRGGGVVLFTEDNLGEARRAGLSLAGARALTSTVSLNASGEAYWMEVPASALGLGAARSGYVVSGRGTLSWSPTASDVFQLNGSLSGRTITPQGSLGAIGLLNLGYRRKLTPALFLVVTAQNLLDSNRQTIEYGLPTLLGRRVLDGVGRTALVTLTYSFGSGAQKGHDPSIDYSSGPAPPR